MKKVWEALALIIVASIAAELLLNVLAPLVPIAVGLGIVLFIGTLFYRRLRRW